LTGQALFAFLLQVNIWEMVQHNGPLGMVVLGILVCFSVYSWTVIFSKWQALRGARRANSRFLRAFRKSSGLEAVMLASEQFRPSPLVAVFDFGYEEIERQVKTRGKLKNHAALERALQLGASEELAKLERNMNWLATTASVTPFIGLFGTVLGIIHAFKDLALTEGGGGPAVMSGIGEALVATAIGLLVAIPAVMMFNFFHRCLHVVQERSRFLGQLLLAHLDDAAGTGETAAPDKELFPYGRQAGSMV